MNRNVIIGVLVVIVAIVAFLIFGNTEEYTEKDKVQLEKSASPKVVSLKGENVFVVTKNDIKFFNSNAKQKWANMYSFSDIFVVNSDKYVLVTELNSQNTQVRVYDKQGLVTTYNVDGEILNADVNNSGQSSVISLNSDKDKYNIKLFDENGKTLVSRVHEVSTQTPVFTELADDGVTQVTNIYDTNYAEPKSEILVTNSKKLQDESESEGVTNEFSYDNQFVIKQSFLKNGMLNIITDRGIYWLDKLKTDNAKEVNSMPLSNKIKFAEYMGNDLVVAYDESLINQTGKATDTIDVISSKKVKSTVEANGDITFLKTFDDGYLVGRGYDFVYYNKSSKEKWNYKVDYEVVDATVVNGGKKAFFFSVDQVHEVDFK